MLGIGLLHDFLTTVMKNSTVSVKRATTKDQIRVTTLALSQALLMFPRDGSVGRLSTSLIDLGTLEGYARPLDANQEFNPLFILLFSQVKTPRALVSW